MQGGIQLRLVMRRGPQVDRAFPIAKDVVTIGRDASNDIVIADPEVSRHHARLLRQPNGALALEDLGSTNGTYVNGNRLSAPQALAPGDTVGLGETIVLQFQAAAGDAGATVVTPRGAYPGDAGTDDFPPAPEPIYPPSFPAAPPVYPPAQPPAQPRPEPARPEPAPRMAPPRAVPPEPPLPRRQPVIQRGVPNTYREPEEAAPPPSSTRTRNALLAGCGCLLLLCVLCAATAWVGDSFFPNTFWSTPPMSWFIDVVRALGLQGLLGGG